MRAVAIVPTYGRPSLAELLAMHQRQTRPIPLLVYVDDAPWLTIANQPNVLAVRAPDDVIAKCANGSVGPLRAAAIDLAVERFELQDTDAIVVLDDDDFYAPHHYAVTLGVLENGAGWTGALAMGLQLARGQAPEFCASEWGCGQHATWAYRLGLYRMAGGYRDECPDDTELAKRMRWESCTPHRAVTHVRRIHGMNLSEGAKYDRARMRREPVLNLAFPTWSSELDMLSRWCAARGHPVP